MSIVLDIDATAPTVKKYKFRLRKYVPCLFKQRDEGSEDNKTVNSNGDGRHAQTIESAIPTATSNGEVEPNNAVSQDTDESNATQKKTSTLSSRRVQVLSSSSDSNRPSPRASASLADIACDMHDMHDDVLPMQTVVCDDLPALPSRLTHKRVSIMKTGGSLCGSQRRDSMRRVSFNALVDVQAALSPALYDRSTSVMEPLTPSRIQIIGQELALYKLTEMAVHRDSVSNISLPYVR
eukprot:Opistho-2@47311